jgi:hypothetical protein
MRKIDNNSTPGEDNLCIEHLKLAHPSLWAILAKLFTLFLKLGFVPSEFYTSLITPIPKSSAPTKNFNINEFRPISINNVISKIFERCLYSFLEGISTSERQYGFKKGFSCANSILQLKKIINYFISKGNTVNLGVIDLQKAFDKVDHYALLNILMNKNIHFQIIDVLHNWLTNSDFLVKWDNTISDKINIFSGVRQGGILSPLLFNIYVDSLLTKLELSGLGCFVNKKCSNSLMYADDLVLLSISITDLQNMLNICHLELMKLNLPINISKSHCIRLGPRFRSPCNEITINNNVIPWVNKIRFLGIFICNGLRLKFDWHEAKSKFYKQNNGILSKLGTNPKIGLALHLVVSQSLPVLMYGIQATSLSKEDISKLSFTYNSIFVKLFNVKNSEIIKQCQYFSGFLTFELQYELSRFKFLHQLLHKDLINQSSELDSPDLIEYFHFKTKFNINDHDSKFNIRDKIWKYFSNSLFPIS